jgi:calcineurin-like phosphoesterase family protein
MNSELIKRHNALVKKDDVVYFLGDIGMGNKDALGALVMAMNGRKMCILGNHDDKRSSWYMEQGWFEWASRHPIIIDEWIILSHEQKFVNGNMPYCNVHGHSHNSLPFHAAPWYFNVSVENTEYEPISLSLIYDTVKWENKIKFSYLNDKKGEDNGIQAEKAD